MEVISREHQEWEGKTWSDFTVDVRESWGDNLTQTLVDRGYDDFINIDYWLEGNRFFRRFYRVNITSLVESFSRVLAITKQLFLENGDTDGEYHHRDKSCKCWKFITSNVRCLIQVDEAILGIVSLDYTLRPQCCYFMELVERYDEWLGRLQRRKVSAKRGRKPKRLVRRR